MFKYMKDRFPFYGIKVLDIYEIAAKNIEKGSFIINDKSTSYKDFAIMFDTYISCKSDKKTTKTTLK